MELSEEAILTEEFGAQNQPLIQQNLGHGAIRLIYLTKVCILLVLRIYMAFSSFCGQLLPYEIILLNS